VGGEEIDSSVKVAEPFSSTFSIVILYSGAAAGLAGVSAFGAGGVGAGGPAALRGAAAGDPSAEPAGFAASSNKSMRSCLSRTARRSSPSMLTLDSVTTFETRFTSLRPTPIRGTVRNGAAALPGWASASEVSVTSPVTSPTARPPGPGPSSSLTAMFTPAIPDSSVAGSGGR
jgi:hypothetical protein